MMASKSPDARAANILRAIEAARRTNENGVELGAIADAAALDVRDVIYDLDRLMRDGYLSGRITRWLLPSLRN